MTREEQREHDLLVHGNYFELEGVRVDPTRMAHRKRDKVPDPKPGAETRVRNTRLTQALVADLGSRRFLICLREALVQNTVHLPDNFWKDAYWDAAKAINTLDAFASRSSTFIAQAPDADGCIRVGAPQFSPKTLQVERLLPSAESVEFIWADIRGLSQADFQTLRGRMTALGLEREDDL